MKMKKLRNKYIGIAAVIFVILTAGVLGELCYNLPVKNRRITSTSGRSRSKRTALH